MKKALMIASVASMIDKFNVRNIDILEKLGYQVDIAANFAYGSITSQERVDQFKEEMESAGRACYHVEIPRSIFKVKQIISAYTAVRNLCQQERYEIVHCHSPIGGVVARLAAIGIRRNGAKVIYTAHGFHFFRGAPAKNWLMFYPVEKICSLFTDILITINQEDYALAKKKMWAKQTAYVPGIGIDTNKFDLKAVGNAEKRKELGLEDTDMVILSVGEISKRKNHEIILRAIHKLGNPNVKYCIGGFGASEQYLRELAKQLGIPDQLLLLGYRSDVAELLNMADVYAFPSLQEGLPVALMEAMSVGKAVVCSRIRGNTDLIEDGKGGFLLDPQDVDGFSDRIRRILEDETLKEMMGQVNRETVKKFDVVSVDREMEKIYSKV